MGFHFLENNCTGWENQDAPGLEITTSCVYLIVHLTSSCSTISMFVSHIQIWACLCIEINYSRYLNWFHIFSCLKGFWVFSHVKSDMLCFLCGVRMVMNSDHDMTWSFFPGVETIKLKCIVSLPYCNYMPLLLFPLQF